MAPDGFPGGIEPTLGLAGSGVGGTFWLSACATAFVPLPAPQRVSLPARAIDVRPTTFFVSRIGHGYGTVS